MATGGYVAAAADGARFGEFFERVQLIADRTCAEAYRSDDTTLFLDDVSQEGIMRFRITLLSRRVITLL